MSNYILPLLITQKARFSTPIQTGPGAHPASRTMGTGSFPGIKSGRDVTLTPQPLLVPWSRKGQSYTSTSPMDHTACTEPQCLYKSVPYFITQKSEHPIYYTQFYQLLNVKRDLLPTDCIYCFEILLEQTAMIFINSVNRLNLVTKKHLRQDYKY